MSKCDNKICSVAKICNPKSGRCVKISGAIGKKILQKNNKCDRKVCPSSKICNPKSGRCVKRTGQIGKKILQSKIKKILGKKTNSNKCIGKSCPSSKICNPKSGRCVKRTGQIGKKILGKKTNSKKCNPKSGRCVKLHGISSFARLDCHDDCLYAPKRVYLIGEIHGSQTCGTTDYISAYSEFLQKNELSSRPKSIDIMLEEENDTMWPGNRDSFAHNAMEEKQWYAKKDHDVMIYYNKMTGEVTFNKPYPLQSEEERRIFAQDSYANIWLDKMRLKFKDCYTYFLNHKCPFKNARFHWTDPSTAHTKNKWLSQVQYASYPPTFKLMKKFYPEVAKQIKTVDDLEKIIFMDEYVMKEGDRCSIPNWKDIIRSQLKRVINTRLQYAAAEEAQEDEQWGKRPKDNKDYIMPLMFEVFRFRMDVYAFLRMFRKIKRNGRFDNVIFHAGHGHIQNMRYLLKAMSYNESIYRSNKLCSQNPFQDCYDNQYVNYDSYCLDLDMTREIVFGKKRKSHTQKRKSPTRKAPKLQQSKMTQPKYQKFFTRKSHTQKR